MKDKIPCWHIIPINDLHPHSEDDKCECKPKVEVVDGGVLVIHNAYDGREIYEDAKRYFEHHKN